MLPTIDEIVAAPSGVARKPASIGRSREGRPVRGYRFGSGDVRLSLIAGCHADEPAGPLLLGRLVSYLASLPDNHELFSLFDWWIVPDINPDGAERNRAWSDGVAGAYDMASYLRHVVRELPGDDIEFGFPRDERDADARPEPRAAYDWWKSDARPFALHASLHGMAVAGGPWFLIDPAWVDRAGIVMERCRHVVSEMGYALHDIERHGEKGFHRIARGFCTRPDSKAMTEFFLERDDPATAAKFRPSSMETVRLLGGDPLTLVSEIPLFVLPGVGERIEPTDPVADEWRARIERWQDELCRAEGGGGAASEIRASGVQPVPIRDQLALQWAFVTAGVEQILTR